MITGIVVNLRINVLQIEVQVIGMRVPIMVKNLFFLAAFHRKKKNLANSWDR